MKIILPIALAGVLASAAPALAVPTTIWAVDATATGAGVGNPVYNAYAEQFSLTGQLLQRVTLGSNFNPSGIAIVGNTGYVSSFDSGTLYTFNLGTGALGATYATGQGALGALTFDGINLLAADADGANVYRYSLTGTFISSFKLPGFVDSPNGLEYEAGTLVANQGQNQGPYNRYSATGTLVPGSSFMAGDGGAIAYNPDNAMQYAAISGGTGGFQTSPGGATVLFSSNIADSGFGTADRSINDLAIQVPEPATLTLLAAGLAFLGVRRRRA